MAPACRSEPNTSQRKDAFIPQDSQQHFGCGSDYTIPNQSQGKAKSYWLMLDLYGLFTMARALGFPGGLDCSRPPSEAGGV